jgi:hypothetical protein
MKNALMIFGRSLPVLFGVGFLGPVLAETILRTSLIDHMPLALSRADVIYALCLIFGFIYGLIAVRFGRWI